MKCSFKIKLNYDVIDQLDKAKKRALYLTADAIKSDIISRAVVPKDTDELENSGFVDESRIDVELIASIVYDTPYARRWYFNADGATFQKTKNANAQDHWMDYYLDGNGKSWVIEQYNEFFKQESGGIIQ